MSLLGAALLRQATTRPTEPALISDGTTVSYAELYAMADRARAGIEEAAPRPDQRLALLVGKSPEAVALVMGAVLAGRCFLMVPQHLPEGTVRKLCREVGGATVFTTVADPRSDHVVAPGMPDAPGPASLPEFRPPQQVPDDALGFLSTTSGSTGAPKIAAHYYAAVDRFINWGKEAFGIGPGTVVLNLTPLSFDVCLVDVWTTLAHGGTVVLGDPDRGAVPSYLHGLIAEHAVEVIQEVPLAFQVLTEATTTMGPLNAPRHVIFHGAPISQRTLHALPAAFPNARLYNLYGCTETNTSFLHELDPQRLGNPPLPLNPSLAGVEWLLEGPDGRAVHGPGEGELLVHSPYQTAGYLNAPTEERFVTHPDGVPGRRYFRSGDLAARSEDGTLTLAGRTDFVVSVRGVQVNTNGVEAVLADHPEVAEVAVVAIPDPADGHRTYARVRLVEDASVTSLGLRQHCAQYLDRTEIPGTLELVTERLPRTSTGKIDRNQVREAQLV